MDVHNIDGIEIDQKLMESLDIADRYGFSDGRFDNLSLYEKREKVVNALYTKYQHIVVKRNDEVYGLVSGEGKYEYIKKADGIYKDLQNTGKI